MEWLRVTNWFDYLQRWEHIWQMGIWSICCLNTNLVLELLTELQRDGEEYQCVIEPGHNTLNLVNMADLKSVVVELTAKEHIQKISKFYDCFYLFPFFFYTTYEMKRCLQHGSRIVQHWASSWLEMLERYNKNIFVIWCTVYTCSTQSTE